MNFLHYNLQLGERDVVVVTLDRPANVQLMDEENYSNYRIAKKFQYYGGYVKVPIYRLPSPHAGKWHLTVDLGGYSGRVHASVNVEQIEQHAVHA